MERKPELRLMLYIVPILNIATTRLWWVLLVRTLLASRTCIKFQPSLNGLAKEACPVCKDISTIHLKKEGTKCLLLPAISENEKAPEGALIF